MTRRLALLFPTLIYFSKDAFVFEEPKKRLSPHQTVSGDWGGKTITITYGRPYLKGRTLQRMTASGEVWRLGADEATKITVSAKTRLGSTLELAPGSYAMFAITGPEKWTLIINKTADQWGAFNYDQSQDLGRFDVPVRKASSPVEQFTIALDKKSDSTGEMTLAWGDQAVSVPVTVS